jgi:DNA-binding NtrC family response regulator
VSPAAVAPAPPESPAAAPQGQPSDILLVDDMENVHKKLRGLLPASVSMTGCMTARDAVHNCQARPYRIIVIDLVMPEVNSVVLMKQLRALQPNAVMVALALRSASDSVGDVRTQGFQDVMFKPFEPTSVEDILSRRIDLGARAGRGPRA